MVTVVRNTNSSQMLGQAAGQGVGQGFAKGAGQALDFSQRQKQVSKVMSPIRELFKDPNATAEDKLLALTEASSFVPGLERMLPVFAARSFMGQMATDNSSSPGITAPSKPSQGSNVSQIQTPTEGAKAPSFGYPEEKDSENPRSGDPLLSMNDNRRDETLQAGLIPSISFGGQKNQEPVQDLPPRQTPIPWQGAPAESTKQTGNTGIKPVEQVRQQAYQNRAATGDPSQANATVAFETSLNELQNAQAKGQFEAGKYEQLESKLEKDLFQELDPSLQGDDLVNFTLASQKFKNLKPIDRYKATSQYFAPIRDVLNSLDHSYVPGAMKGFFGKDAFKNRENQLKKLDPIINKLSDMGERELAIKKLHSLGLSPTEIQERFHPVDKKLQTAINGAKPAPFSDRSMYSKNPISDEGLSGLVSGVSRAGHALLSDKYQSALDDKPELVKKYNNDLRSFLEKNLTNDSSLLVLRDKLIRQKGYDYRQFPDVISEMQRKGFKFTPDQDRELESLNEPPIDSLANIFNSWDRFSSFMSGAK